MNTQVLIPDSIPAEPTLPTLARTRSGIDFDPSQDLWRFRDGVKNVHLDFEGWGLENFKLKIGFKGALLWLMQNMSPSHAINMHVKMKHLFKFLNDNFSDLPTEISEEHLISYSAEPDVLKNGYLSSLSCLHVDSGNNPD